MPAPNDPCVMLNELRAAYYLLLTGHRRAQVRNGDQWTIYQKGDTAKLKAEIDRLEVMCDPRLSQARAVRIGPYVRRNPFSRYY